MSIPTQSGVAQRGSVATESNLSRSEIDTDEGSSHFHAVLDQGVPNESDSGQTLTHKREQLDSDLMRFRNGEISASELEASIVAFEIALEDAGIETHGFVEGGQLMFTRLTGATNEFVNSKFDSPFDQGPVEHSTLVFARMSEQEQRATVQVYLDNYDPVQFYGEQLASTLADFHGQRASGQELEQAVVDFFENLSATGTFVPGSVENGEFIWRNLKALEKIRHDPNEPPPRLDTPFSWLERDDQASVAASMLEDFFHESPAALRAEQHNLAANLIVEHLGVSDDPTLAAQIGAQAARVEALIESFSQSATPTQGERDRLVEETSKLVALYEAAGIESSLWSHDADSGVLIASFGGIPPLDPAQIAASRPPSGLAADIFGAVQSMMAEELAANARPMADLEPAAMASLAAGIVALPTTMASKLSLDHHDILGGPIPMGEIVGLQAALAQAQEVPDNINLDMVFQASYADAQLRLAAGDLQYFEYRLIEAIGARLGDQGWGVGRDALFIALRMINEGAEIFTLFDNNPPVGETEFVNAWNNSSREARIEYLGFDVQTWNEIEPLLAQAYSVHEARKDAEFDVEDAIKLVVGMAAATVTGGAVSSAVTSWLGGTAATGVLGAAAGAVGTAAGAATGSLVSSLIVSGDWVTARESFKDIFEGDLKEGLAEVVLNYIGLDSSYAALVNVSVSDENVDQLTQELGLDLVQQFGGPFIDGLKAVTPEVVDNYLDDLKKVLLTTDDPTTIAEHAIGWWGSELSAMLGVTNQNGIHLVTSLLDTAVTTGEFNVDALQEFLGQEVVDYLADVPAEVVERLGGEDSALALLGGVAAQLVVNNLDTAIEGDSFIDAAREEFETFITDLANSWVEQGGLEGALSWIPGSANWSGQFSELVNFGKENGWDNDALQAHLSESSLFTNLINSYVPNGVAHNFLTNAVQYASENGFDTQTILTAATVDMVDILANAGISQDVVNFLGGDSAMLTQMSNVFGERLIANDGDLDATLSDMEKYAHGLAAGHVGTFTQSMLAQVLGSGAGPAIDAVSGLAEGVAAGWSDEQIDQYIGAEILSPLGDSAAAVVSGAFGGEDNFVAGLLGVVTDAYVTNPGDGSAAQSAASDYLLSQLAGLVGSADTQSILTQALGPDAGPAIDAVTGLVEGMADGWSDAQIDKYVDEQILTPLGDATGSFVSDAFGGDENFVAGLLGAVTDAFVTNPGDSGAASAAAMDYLMAQLQGLLAVTVLGSRPEIAPLAGASPFSLADSVAQLVEFANENDWNQQKIQAYIESEFLNNGLAGNLIDTFPGGFGSRAELSAMLVEELISDWRETGKPEAVIEGFVSFILNPPALPDADQAVSVS